MQTTSASPTVQIVKFTLHAAHKLVTGRVIAPEVTALANLTGETPKDIENALRSHLTMSGLGGHVQCINDRAQALQDALDMRDQEEAALDGVQMTVVFEAEHVAALPTPATKKPSKKGRKS